MRRTHLKLFLLLIVTLLVSACSRQSIYENAIDWERSSAGLKAAQVTVGDLDIAYLRSEEPVDGDTLVLIHASAPTRITGPVWPKSSRVSSTSMPSICQAMATAVNPPWTSATVLRIR